MTEGVDDRSSVCGGAPQFAQGARRRRWLLAALVSLASCGGGDRTQDPPVVPDTLSGTVSSTGPVNELSVNVMASNLLVLNRRSDAEGHFESQPLTRSPAPYLLQTNDGPGWSSVAIRPGHANINPLTTLVVAQLVGERPDNYYYAIAPQRVIDFPTVTQADIDAAHAEVVQRLGRQFGLSVPASITSFIETPYRAVAGDPMHELLVALDSALAAAGIDLPTLASEVAAESLRCRRERLGIDLGAQTTVLCPFERSTAVDAQDPMVTLYGFNSAWADRLTLRVRGDEVEVVELLLAGGQRFTCGRSAPCTGVTVGASDAQGRRSVAFASTRLSGGQGSLTLDGRLTTGEGITPADCAGPGWRVTLADGSGERDCVGARQAAVDYGRDIFAFQGRLDATRRLELRLDGARVAWVSLSREGVDGVDYRCRYDGCKGIVVGEADAEGRRRIEIAGLMLERANNDGSVLPQDTARIDAQLVSAPAARKTSFCTVVSTIVAVSTLGGAQPMCIDGRAELIDFRLDEANQPNWFWIQLADGLTGTPLWLEVDMLGTDAAVVQMFQDGNFAKVIYRCDGPGCAGLGGSFGNLRLTAQLDGMVLREIEPDNGPGDRTLMLTGWARTTFDLIF